MLGSMCLGIFICSLFDIGYFIEEVYLIPSLAGFMYSVLFFILLNAFTNIPRQSDKKVALFTRIKIWFLRMGYRILACIFLLMSIAGIVLSVRLLGVWYAS